MKLKRGLSIIVIGNLIVNLPVSFCILAIAFLLEALIGLSIRYGLILGVFVGWQLWSRLLDLWIKWALGKGISRDELYKLGKIGLINFYRHKIFKER